LTHENEERRFDGFYHEFLQKKKRIVVREVEDEKKNVREIVEGI
jgi:hypothetical protein